MKICFLALIVQEVTVGVSEALDFLCENSEELAILLNMEVTVEGVSEALDFLCENSEELAILLNDTNSPLPSAVPGVVPLETKETRTTGSDLKGKQTHVDDEPDGSASESRLRYTNFGRTAPLESQFSSPAAGQDTTNHNVASSFGPCKTKKKYSLEEQQNLTLAIAIRDQKWQEIEEMLKGTGRSHENWKQKWKEMMQKATMQKALNNMDENQKWLHIVAAIVQFNVGKHSHTKQEFQKWFEGMGKED
ncbi:unnamed protein product [Camellia sinensis]